VQRTDPRCLRSCRKRGNRVTSSVGAWRRNDHEDDTPHVR
jgi:hypothetical protein